jgi:Icc protein
MALIAQLTDPHLRDDGKDPFHDPAVAMQQAFAQISAMDRKPDAIILTGDIIDRSAAGYGHALPILRRAPAPILPMPGNHDDPLAFRAAFADWAAFAPDHLSFTARIADLDMIALDSTLPDGRPGLDPTRLDWLAGVLGTLQRPSVLALHHPPFPTLAPHLDKPGFQNVDAFARMIACSGVRRIIAGHSHRAMQTVWAGTLASTAPALGHGLSLSLSGDENHKPIATMPAFELHLVGQRDMISHYIAVD